MEPYTLSNDSEASRIEAEARLRVMSKIAKVAENRKGTDNKKIVGSTEISLPVQGDLMYS